MCIIYDRQKNISSFIGARAQRGVYLTLTSRPVRRLGWVLRGRGRRRGVCITGRSLSCQKSGFSSRAYELYMRSRCAVVCHQLHFFPHSTRLCHDVFSFHTCVFSVRYFSFTPFRVCEALERRWESIANMTHDGNIGPDSWDYDVLAVAERCVRSS